MTTSSPGYGRSRGLRIAADEPAHRRTTARTSSRARTAAPRTMYGLSLPPDAEAAVHAAVREVVACPRAGLRGAPAAANTYATVEWLRSTAREITAHGMRSRAVSLLDAERVARAEYGRGFAAGRAAATHQTRTRLQERAWLVPRGTPTGGIEAVSLADAEAAVHATVREIEAWLRDASNSPGAQTAEYRREAADEVARQFGGTDER